MISYRNFQEDQDLELQRKFWMEVTKELPWAWKPNRSQQNFAKSPDFDPRTKTFAFEREELVGYMSCIKRERFIPFGFPWVRKGYEGEVQEELYRRMFEFASGPLGGKSFLQRFREEWTSQIDFFRNKGFQLAFSYPIYIRNLNSAQLGVSDSNFTTKILPNLPSEILTDLASKDTRYKTENITELYNFYTDIDFDLILVLYDNDKAISMTAVTSREDTAYSELNLVISDDEYPKATNSILEYALEELYKRQRKHVSITLEEDDPIITTVESFNFHPRSRSVFYRKELE
ncbi:MAG: hypothetical protein ACXABU_03310 [Candidatus Hodarchaeales archaeon]|jgi:hypothetical protein